MKSRLIFSVMITVLIALFARGLSPILAQDEPQEPNKVEVKEIFDILGQFLDCENIYKVGKTVNLVDAMSKGTELFWYNYTVSEGQSPKIENPVKVNQRVSKLLDIFAVTCITADLVIEKFDEPAS